MEEPPGRSPPASASHNTPPTPSPAPPATATPPSSPRRHHTGQSPPSPVQTPGGRTPPAGALAARTPVLHLLTARCSRRCNLTDDVLTPDPGFIPQAAVSWDHFQHSGFRTHTHPHPSRHRCWGLCVPSTVLRKTHLSIRTGTRSAAFPGRLFSKSMPGGRSRPCTGTTRRFVSG